MTPRLQGLILTVLLLAAPLAAGAQQGPDTLFDSRVARPMFTVRHPTLLFDQGHHNTHTTRNRYDALAQLAIADGFEVLINASPFQVKDLQDTRVLLIANALGSGDLHSPAADKPAFTAAECDAVRDWVRAGGSLLLVAEHPPMGPAAKRLAARFGVDFSTGYLSDLNIADTAFGASTLVFSTKTGTLGDHIILRGRSPDESVQRVRTYTGQSLAGPAGSVALLKVTDRAQDYMLGTAGVKGPIPDSLKHSAAGRAQGIAFTFGKGRVVMLGEATMLAAQLVPGPAGQTRKLGMNSPGFDNRQFALNVLRWLAHGLN